MLSNLSQRYTIDLNYRHIRAIMVLQTLYKQRKQHVATLNRRVGVIYVSLVSIMNNLNNLYINNVINQEEYSSLMLRLNDVLEQYTALQTPLNTSIFKQSNYDEVCVSVAYIECQTVDLIKQCGASNIYDILKMVVGPNWSVGLKLNFSRLLKFFNTVFVPRSVMLTSLSAEREPPTLPEVKMYSAYTESVLLQLYGAEIVLPIFNKLLVLKGYFRNDPLNIAQQGGTLGKKRADLDNALEEMQDIDPIFRERFVKQLSLRDFLSLSTDKLALRVESAHVELAELLVNPLSFISEQFAKSKMDNKRKILTLLLLDSEQRYAKSLISSLTTDDSKQLNRVYKYLHWSVQRIFDEVTKKLDTSGVDLNVESENLPYELRIDNLKANETVKRRARDKLKEIKNSRDGNEKATKYLDGLLRIPFGNYKHERMLRFLSEFKKEINEINEQLESFLAAENNTDLSSLIEDLSSYGQVKTANDVKRYVLVLKGQQGLLEKLYSAADSNRHYRDSNEFNFVQRLLNMINSWQRYTFERQEYMNKVADKLECIYGQVEAKRKVQSIIAQWINGEMEGAVFGFQGPPGTGKTSLAKEGLAECLTDDDGTPRPFAFIALGGSTNGSTLEGHGYTYVGSKWGRIADVLMDTGCMNPIIYFDELDKISKSSHGQEITGILTHLTDPQQNDQFIDRYFDGIKIDLSKVLIIFSYNDADLVDPILMDRITEVNFKHLTSDEKRHIAHNFMLPKILKSVGYTTQEICFSDEAISHIVESYVYEAGVRQLKEKLYEIARELNTRHMQYENKHPLPIHIDKDLVDDILARKNRISITKIPKKPQIGWVNGLYATKSGIGGLVIIQVTETFSEQKFSIDPTGSLGDVLKESIKCAKTITWRVLSKEKKQELTEEWKDHPYGLHIHFPNAGSKDGPSAGAAITTAVISYLCGIKVRNYIAMTGEIDLYGAVHAIGGLQAKIEGAIRAGAKVVLIPNEINGEEWDDMAEQYKDKVTVVKVDHIAQVLRLCFPPDAVDKLNLNLDEDDADNQVVNEVLPLLERLDKQQVLPPPTPQLDPVSNKPHSIDEFKL